MKKTPARPSFLLVLALALLSLASCDGLFGSKSSYAGTYAGSVDGQSGTLILVVTGSEVTRIRITLTYSGSGSVTTATFDANGNWPVSGGSFSIDSALNGMKLTVSGTLDGKGKASGSAALAGKGNYSWAASLNSGSTVGLATPVFAVSGEDGASATVSLSCANSRATIYYSTMGADPKDGQNYERHEYTGPFLVSRDCLVKAVALLGTEYSEVSEKLFSFSDNDTALTGAWIKTIGTQRRDSADALLDLGDGVTLAGSCAANVLADGTVNDAGKPVATFPGYGTYAGLTAGPDGSVFRWNGYDTSLDLARYDSTGEQIWEKTFPYSFPDLNNANALDVHALLPRSDGSLVVGAIEGGKLGLLFINADASVNSFVQFAGTTFSTNIDRVCEIQATTHNGQERFIILAMLDKPGMWDDDRSFALVETDSAGAVIRAVQIDSGLADRPSYYKSYCRFLANADGSGLLAFGIGNANESEVYSGLMLLNTDWTLKASRGLGHEGAVAAKAEDGGYLVAVAARPRGSSTDDDLCLMKFDADLNPLWTKTWGGLYSDDQPTAILAKGGNIYLAGRTWSYGNGYLDTSGPFDTMQPDIWLLKLASDGSAPAASPAHGRFGDDFLPALPTTMATPTVTPINLSAMAGTLLTESASSAEEPAFGESAFEYAVQYPAGY